MATPDYTQTELNLSCEDLIYLPDDIDKYTNLKILHCYDNKIIQLDNLPQNLKELYCQDNKITQLDNLPQNLEKLCCNLNKITKLNNLPNSLIDMECNYNPLQYDFKPTLANIRHYLANVSSITSIG